MPAPPPAYRQFSDALRLLLRTGSYEPGSRFLTEREVAARFSISRPTANKVLATLVGEGLLEFRKGLGTFVGQAVGQAPLDYDLRALVSFTNKASAAGRLPRTSVLHFERLGPGATPAEVAARLAITPQERVYRLERLRLAGETPLILERRYIRARFCPRLRSASVGGSIYDLWVKHYGLDIAGAGQTIRAVALQPAEAALLGVPEGSPALLNLSTGYLNTQEPLWYEETLYRGDAYEFVNRISSHTLNPV